MSSTRRQFLQASAAAGAGTVAAPLPEAAAAGEGSHTMDQLTDASGKYAHLIAASTAVEASGRGMRGYHGATRKLMVLQCENRQKLAAYLRRTR